jgi:hypothetical protein
MRTDAITIDILAGLACLCIYLVSLYIKKLCLSFYNLMQSFCCGPGIATGILLIGNELFVLNPKYVINERVAVTIGGIVLTCFAIAALLKAIGIKFENATFVGNNVKSENK